MKILILLSAVAVIWLLILKEQHRKVVREYLQAVVMWAALVVGVIALYYLNEWQYKRDHTIFIGDPKKSSWEQH